MHWPFKHFHHGRRHNGPTPVLIINGVAVELLANEVIHMASTIVVGEKSTLILAFLDQHDNPMVPTPKPDGAPIWTNTTPANEMVIAATDGLSAVQTALTAGSDTVSVTVIVGGNTFPAQLSVTISPEPQMLTSVRIVAGTPV